MRGERVENIDAKCSGGPKGLGNIAQASMKPNLSSTRCEKAFFQGLWFIWSEIRQEIGCDRLWCLIGTVRGTSTVMIKHQSQLLF